MKRWRDAASRQPQENRYVWSGKVEKASHGLLLRGMDAERDETGVMWVPVDKAADLASALLAQAPGGSEFIEGLMRQSLVGRIPDEYLDKAAECTTAGALMAIEHAVALADKARNVQNGAVRAKKKWGTDNVVPTGENEGLL